jgi:hypothetical protein
VELNVPLPDGLSLRIADRSPGERGYPTARLQKGLLLLHEGEDLAEEGVGFGVPVLKRGVLTVFPGRMSLGWRHTGAVCEVTATFEMDLVERLARTGGAALRPKALYAAKNTLAALHRRSRPLRGLLSATSSGLRRTFRWRTTFEETRTVATLHVRYAIDAERGRIGIEVDMSGRPGDGVSEVVVMNEQGARHFDRYRDADGTILQGREIGTWDRVAAQTACFVCAADGVAFSLDQVDGARLYRGRELIGERVAWAGFGYSLPPTRNKFGYEVRIERAT